MARSRVGLLVVAIAAAAVLAAPGAAFGANAYGQTFAGKANCLSCHGATSGRWQVGTYGNTMHARMVTDVQETTSALEPTSAAMWPSPSVGTGLRFAASEIKWMLGGPGWLKEYVTVYKNDKPYTLASGQVMNPVAGPADDYLTINGAEWDPVGKLWELPAPASVRLYFQSCGGCHHLGVTRPGYGTYTLPNGGTMTHSTETTVSGVGIQCENCHGTGKAGTSHWTSNVDIVRTKQVLKSQTCGQCHVNGTAKGEKNYNNGTFSSPNGFTTDKNLEDFFNITGINYMRTSPASPTMNIPASDTKFYPNGMNKSMNHNYYNEWLLTPHARSLKYRNGEFWSPNAQDSCLQCHSGEGYLNRIGYGADGPNDIALGGSSLASDTLNVECGVCHEMHGKDGTPAGLRMKGDELCGSCHNMMVEEGTELEPGSYAVHTQREMREGYGLIGVAEPAKRFMGDTECPACHMPSPRIDRPSHSFIPMTPQMAIDWNVRAGGDSCTGCHPSKSLTTLAADMAEWKTDLTDKAAEATASIAAARTRESAGTDAATRLLAAAQTNVDFVLADESNGAHNYPYAAAGLDKADYFARAAGASFTRFGATEYYAPMAISTLYGTLVMGDGTAAAGEKVVIEALPAGATTWTKLGTVTVGDDGDIAYTVSPTGTTSYRARFIPLDDEAAIVSPLGTVTMGTTTTIRLSSRSFGLGRETTVIGTVSPAHAGSSVTIRYKLGNTGKWTTLATKTLSDDSDYSYTWKPAAKGTYYIRTTFGGDTSHAGSTSVSVPVRVY